MSRFFGKRNIHEHERMPTDGRGVPEGKAFLYVREIFRKRFPTVVLKYRNRRFGVGPLAVNFLSPIDAPLSP